MKEERSKTYMSRWKFVCHSTILGEGYQLELVREVLETFNNYLELISKNVKGDQNAIPL